MVRSTAAHRRALRSAAALLAALLGVASLVAALAPAAAASGSATGWVRAAHFSPDTPRVDVYLSAFGRTDDPTVLEGVGYGAVSPYMQVPAGAYTVAMRAQGAAASSPPVIETTVQVGAGTASTVAGVGANADLTLSVLPDDLTPPPAGQGKARVIQASLNAPTVDTVELGGTALARNLAFPQTSAYTAVPAGATQVTVGSAAGTAQRPLDVRAGGTYTIVVRDVTGGIDVFAIQDAASSQVVPNGAIDAGFGGSALSSAGEGSMATNPWVLAGAAAVIGVALAAALPGWARSRARYARVRS